MTRYNGESPIPGVIVEFCRFNYFVFLAIFINFYIFGMNIRPTS